MIKIKDNEKLTRKQAQTKTSSKRPIYLVAAVLTLVIAVVLFFVKGTPTIDVNKYITIEVEGYDGAGRAVYNIDYDKFESDNGEKILKTYIKKNKDLDKSELYRLEDNIGREFLNDCVEVSWKEGSTNGQYSNNDIATLSVVGKSVYAEEIYGVKLRVSDVNYKVKGLEELTYKTPEETLTKAIIAMNNNDVEAYAACFTQEAREEEGFRESFEEGQESREAVKDSIEEGLSLTAQFSEEEYHELEAVDIELKVVDFYPTDLTSKDYCILKADVDVILRNSNGDIKSLKKLANTLNLLTAEDEFGFFNLFSLRNVDGKWLLSNENSSDLLTEEDLEKLENTSFFEGISGQ